MTNMFNICKPAIFTSYCINTTKYLPHAIFKKKELMSSPLILHKANLFTSYCINTTKYLLHAILKKKELMSSPLILHKANLLRY